MHVIKVTNVNQALSAGLRYLLDYGVQEPSRNGPVLVAPGPVTTVYTRPWERVLFSPLRDANPFLHFFESLWMLAGNNDVKYLTQFTKRFADYSDDGPTLWGAYGHRWRHFFGWDQIRNVIEELRRNPTSRRCVMSMWNNMDVTSESVLNDFHTAVNGGKDVPCNTHIYFDLRGKALNMTVCNRSNDVLWGAYGANVVHMSWLQELIAQSVGVPMGEYRQMSNNYHIYTDVLPAEKVEALIAEGDLFNLYDNSLYRPMYVNMLGRGAPTGEGGGGMDQLSYFYNNLEEFITSPETPKEPTNSFIDLAQQMWKTHTAHKAGKFVLAKENAASISPMDWRLACERWLNRRYTKKGANGAE